MGKRAAAREPRGSGLGEKPGFLLAFFLRAGKIFTAETAEAAFSAVNDS